MNLFSGVTKLRALSLLLKAEKLPMRLLDGPVVKTDSRRLRMRYLKFLPGAQALGGNKKVCFALHTKAESERPSRSPAQARHGRP